MLVVVQSFHLQLLPSMMSHAPKICCNECFVPLDFSMEEISGVIKFLPSDHAPTLLLFQKRQPCNCRQLHAHFTQTTPLIKSITKLEMTM
jgi:hypothetical protein